VKSLEIAIICRVRVRVGVVDVVKVFDDAGMMAAEEGGIPTGSYRG
jgi:hypothetical protein